MIKNRGFTLIELMIVVCIIGILAALAVSQYTSYTTKAKLAEVIMHAEGIKKRLQEYFALNGTFEVKGGNVFNELGYTLAQNGPAGKAQTYAMPMGNFPGAHVFSFENHYNSMVYIFLLHKSNLSANAYTPAILPDYALLGFEVIHKNSYNADGFGFEFKCGQKYTTIKSEYLPSTCQR